MFCSQKIDYKIPHCIFGIQLYEGGKLEHFTLLRSFKQHSLLRGPYSWRFATFARTLKRFRRYLQHAASPQGTKILFSERNLSNAVDFDGIADRVSLRCRPEINWCVPLCLCSMRYKIFAVACGVSICMSLTGS